jgi:sulfatase modifying factor 1
MKRQYQKNSILSFILMVFVLALVIPFSAVNSQNDQRSGDALAKKSELVLIHGGEFIMGKQRPNEKPKDKKSNIDDPAHKVYVDSFYIEKYEVTNAHYYTFCKETGRKLPEFWGMNEFHCGLDFPDHPVVGVSYADAKAYAEWKGMRLPSEAEWEYAARGGLMGKEFPDGDDLDVTLANFAPGSKGTVIVGSYPPNKFGLYDMAGNVAEWVLDYYDRDYYPGSPYKNPGGPEVGKHRVIRGGGWHSGKFCNRVYYRNSLGAGWCDFNVGFRCVREVEKKPSKTNR